jgi:large subunit ribosomal protein L25
MKAFSLSGSPRENVGKKDAAQLRKNEMVPCVLYGGEQQHYFDVKYRVLTHLVYTPEVYTVALNLGGKEFKALMQEIQFHPVNDSIMHIDFLLMDESKPVVIDIPVKVAGSSIGVKQGGKLVINVRKLKVRALPKNLPDFVEVNVEHLDIGQAVKVGSVSMEGVTFLDAPNVVIAAVRMTRAAAAAAAAEAAPAKKK